MKGWIAAKLILLATLLTMQGWGPVVTADTAVDFTVKQCFDVARATVELARPTFEADGEPTAESTRPVFVPWLSAERSSTAPVAAPEIRQSTTHPPVRAPPIG